MKSKLFAAALAASVATFAAHAVAQETNSSVTYKAECDAYFQNCDSSVSGSYSQKDTYGNHTETKSIEIGINDNGKTSLEGTYKNEDNN